MKIVSGLLFLLIYCLTLTCTPTPLENENKFPIRLSLERVGTTEAEFSGAPILAIVETPDFVMYDTLNWKTGNGEYLIVDSALTKKSKRFQAKLSWKMYPSIKDSLGEKYDTIFVGIGGNIYRSNSVRVKVSNLPVVIDSLQVNVSVFKNFQPVWSFTVHDSIKKLHIRMAARDLDDFKRTPSLSVIGNNYSLEQNILQPMQMIYSCPLGPFKDTLTFIVYDHSRGQAIRSLYLDRTLPNYPPVIDSVALNGKWFKIVSGKTSATVSRVDTLRFKVHYHDHFDTIKTVTWRSSKNTIKIDSLHPESMIYICTLPICKDTLTKGFTTIDTVIVTVFDSKNVSAKASVVIVKGIANRSPVIEKITVNGKNIADNTSEIPIMSGSALTTYVLGVKVSDPDSNVLQTQWTAKYGTFDIKTGVIVAYTAPATLVMDTVTVTVADNEYSVIKKMVIRVDDLIPVFDSLVINTSRFTKPDSSIYYDASIGERLVATAWVQDKDIKDTLEYKWSMSDSSKIISRKGNRIIVQLLLKAYNDTIKLTLQDGTYEKIYKVFIKAAIQEPLIDSIIVRTKSYKTNVASITDTVAALDTIPLKVFAHDNQADTLSYKMSAIVKKSLSKVDSVTYKYIPPDSTYTDTIKILVTDSKGNIAKKNVVLIINSDISIPIR